MCGRACVDVAQAASGGLPSDQSTETSALVSLYTPPGVAYPRLPTPLYASNRDGSAPASRAALTLIGRGSQSQRWWTDAVLDVRRHMPLKGHSFPAVR